MTIRIEAPEGYSDAWVIEDDPIAYLSWRNEQLVIKALVTVQAEQAFEETSIQYDDREIGLALEPTLKAVLDDSLEEHLRIDDTTDSRGMSELLKLANELERLTAEFRSAIDSIKIREANLPLEPKNPGNAEDERT